PVEIPLYSFAQPSLKCLLGIPAEFTLDLGGINGVAPVVARAVWDETEQAGKRIDSIPGQFGQDRANMLHDIEVLPVIITANVIRLTHTPTAEDRVNALAVIFHIQPVPDVGTITVDRNWFSCQAGTNNRWDQFLSVLKRTVVVGAIAGAGRQSIRPVVGAYQVIGSRFARRIWGIRSVRRAFAEGRVVRTQGAIHLVGRDVME